MGELLLFFGREFTASELYNYFRNDRQLVTKRKHAWTNETRKRQTLQHQRLVGNYGLGPDTPQGSADAKEVAAVAEAIGGKAGQWLHRQQRGIRQLMGHRQLRGHRQMNVGTGVGITGVGGVRGAEWQASGCKAKFALVVTLRVAI